MADDWNDDDGPVYEDADAPAVAPPPKAKVPTKAVAKPVPVAVTTAAVIPAAEPAPVPGWQTDPEYVAAVTRRDELAAKLAAVRAERAGLDAEVGTDKAGDPVEAQARRLLAGGGGGAGDAAGRRERRDALLADEKVLTRAVQLARAEADAARDRLVSAWSVEKYNSEFKPLEVAAARAYLEFTKLATRAARTHRQIVAGAGGLLACPYPVFTPFGHDGDERWGVWPAVLPTAHDAQGAFGRLVAAGAVTAAEVDAAFPGWRG